MSLRFSGANYSFPLLPFTKALHLLRLLELERVDLGLFAWGSHLQPADLLPDPASAARRIKDELNTRGLAASDVFLQAGVHPADLSANDPDPAVRAQAREVFRAALEFTAAIGSPHMTGLPGVRHVGLADEVSLALATEEAAWRSDVAARAGVCYGIEPHLGSICVSIASTKELLRRAPAVSLTLDYGHFIVQGVTNEEIHELLPRTSHFHARGACPGELQARVRDNAIDFTRVVGGVGDWNYNGIICLEYVWAEWENCCRVDNVSEILLLREHLMSLLRGCAKTISLR